MNQWRPQPKIRLKSLGLHWRNGRLLATEVYGDAGQIKGVRPLGGTVEFEEELHIDVTVINQPFYMENIYVHEGASGHELLAIFNVSVPVGAFDGEDRIQFYEDNGQVCFAEWFDLEKLDCPGYPDLYPTGLKTHLLKLSE